jgi:hypothetical protein
MAGMARSQGGAGPEAQSAQGCAGPEAEPPSQPSLAPLPAVVTSDELSAR